MKKFITLLMAIPCYGMDADKPNQENTPITKRTSNLTQEERNHSSPKLTSSKSPMHLDVKFHDEKTMGEKTVFYTSSCITSVCTLFTGLLALATLIVSIVALAKDCKK